MRTSTTPSKTKRILIIEDDPMINGVLKRKLDAKGMTADMRVNGSDTLLSLDSDLYDLILLDLRLPGRDGHAILEAKPATANAATPVLVLTSVCDSEEMERARFLGALRCLSKLSTRPDDVIREVQEIIG